MTQTLTTKHKQVSIGDLDITIRPIGPADKGIEAAFVHKLSLQTKYERFFEGINDLTPSMLSVLCNIDYVNSMAYIATIQTPEGEQEIGVSRYSIDKIADEREMAIVVADDCPFKEIATILLNSLIEHAKTNNVKRLVSIELSTNYRMHDLAEQFAMKAKAHPNDNTLVVYTLDL